ncbi:MAG: putative DNA repair helicase RadD [Firmicutes bacterium]|nr:putative DNA repair helicase RadD [candidate division NPL-UPA2 bacterium]MBT9154404.1 putative DNA repair helicase RadD [candidate division NPL-UPA2 bacterium]
MPAVTNTAQHMATALAEQCQQSTAIRFAVSFVRESGVKTLLEPLLRAADRKIPIEIITGTYMNVTEPSALYLLRHKLGDRLKLRLYDDRRKSFHLKAYFFEQPRDATVFVGSSNISQAALTTGVEWNYGLRRSVDQAAFAEFERVYQVIKHSAVLADDMVLRNYAKHWRKPKQLYLLDDPESDNYTVLPIVEPRGAQIEALYELERTREDGFDKALVIAATGTGKTYLAAFDSLGFSRVLFVAHREEILKQAEASFRAVRPAATTGLFMGTSKDTEQSLIFASVQTLGRAEHLNASYFDPTDFDYMVVDEFHHAAAISYQNLLSYFKPKFLLGLTATPDRMDNKDIYTLCEHNVAYEVSLKGAINRDWLVPFRYYGIFDATDYEQIDYQNGKYDVAQLEDSLSRLERAQLVFEHYTRYRRSRALGFCVSVKHAEYMAAYFNQQGVKAACVTSNGTSSYSQDRSDAIKGLKEKKIEVIFSVDMFNEGVDIPAVDMVMFLRPTESYTIFMQQLGRGLRKVEGKEHLLVLDFIGNYRKAHFKPSFLSGDISFESARGGVSADDIPLPDGCTANIDFRLVDIFRRLEQREPIKVQLVAEYRDLAKRFGRRPSREEINLHGGLPFRLYYQRFDSWLRFLEEVCDLTDEEKSWLGTPAEKFLREMERTSMSKSYKVPTIQAFLLGDTIVPRVSLEAIGQSFRDFYSTTKHQVDLQDKRHAAWRTWALEKYMKLAEENPVHFLSQGRNGLFAYDKAMREFSIVPAVAPYLSPLMAQHVADVLQYKTADYFRRHY